MSISAKCPHCGVESNVEAKYAGMTGPCRNCGKDFTIAGGANPFTSDAGGRPNAAVSPAKRSAPIVAILAVGVICLVMCIGVLTALLLPAVQAAREAARRAQCTNNVRQIQLAVLNYESANGHLPPSYVADSDGRPMHSWRILILPYLDETGIYEQYNMEEPWDSPGNRALTEQYMPAVFQCPSDPNGFGESTDTSYVAVTGPGAPFSVDAKNLSQITDGTSKTLSIVEMADSGIHWSEPRDWDVGNSKFVVNGGKNEISSHHPGSAIVSQMDGFVTQLSDNVDPVALEAMTTVAGGETVNLD